MDTKAKKNAESKSNATSDCISSGGEIFADGAMIELIAGSSGHSKPVLLLWSGSKATIGPRVKHRGRTYEAPELTSSLCRTTRLPQKHADYGSARGLFTSISDLFKQRLDLPERESSLLSCFSISTWLADRLPSAPGLTISGPDEELGIDVLRLLSCVCRHPLLLAELTAGDFRSLPTELSFTLLLLQQELKPNMRRLLRASSYRGLYLSGNRGRVVDLYGPKAIFCGNDVAVETLSGGLIKIVMAPSRLPTSALDEQKISNEFQPLLLMYRLKNAPKVHESRADLSKFAFATRPLARALAMCFPEDSALAGDAVQLLGPQDEELREQRFLDVSYAIVEVLWGIVHNQKLEEVRVEELAKDVNAMLRSRGELIEYSAEEVGWKLRGLGVPRHTSSSGRQVLLGRDTSQIIHRLAQAYDSPCARRAEAGCQECNQERSANSKRFM